MLIHPGEVLYHQFLLPLSPKKAKQTKVLIIPYQTTLSDKSLQAEWTSINQRIKCINYTNRINDNPSYVNAFRLILHKSPSQQLTHTYWEEATT